MKASRVTLCLAIVLVIAVLAGCTAPAAPLPQGQAAAAQPAAAGTKTMKDLVLCFPQLGAESDWRTANTASMKETAEKLGIKQLVFSDAQQKQENQISAYSQLHPARCGRYCAAPRSGNRLGRSTD